MMSTSSTDTILTLVSGGCWTIAYLLIIYRGFKDKTYGMPMFALAFNISWEFIFAFLIGSGSQLQKVVNMVWFVFDLLIIYTYLKYGRKYFPKTISGEWFLPWSMLSLVVSFCVVYFIGREFGDPWGARYAAFFQNLMMSVLFINMLIVRNSTEGQSVYIAMLKWIGTAAPTLQIYLDTHDSLILSLGICIFVYDVIYIIMLNRKPQGT